MLQPPQAMWYCSAFPTCEAYVRCHEGTTAPMGTLAGPRLRKLRGMAHDRFDPLWREGGKVIGRSMAYLVAGRVMGVTDFHIGHLDEDGCLQFLGLIERIDDELTAFADALLNPRNDVDDSGLEILHAVFCDDASGVLASRVNGREITRLGLLAEQLVADGLVVIDDDDENKAHASLTAKGRRVLVRFMQPQ